MQSESNLDQLKRYMDTGFKAIEGWAPPEAAKILTLVDSLDFNHSGGVMEIGVHHGLFFLMLLQVAEPNSVSYAIDLFDNQVLNVDYSGRGDRSAFEENLEKYGNGKPVRVVSADSTDFRAIEMLNLPVGEFKFISVDGGHTAEHTCSDLKLAEKHVSNEGLVILDDFPNIHWLGVSEGAFRYISSRPTLVPLAVGHNKLYFCKVSYFPRYWQAFENSDLVTKKVEFMGHKLAAL